MTGKPKGGYKPSRVTMAQAQSRIGDIVGLVAVGDHDEAELESGQLILDILYSLANAPTMADKREMKKLADAGLKAYAAARKHT